MNNLKTTEIKEELKRYFNQNHLNYYELYSKNFKINNDQVFFMIEISQNEIESFDQLNQKIKLHLQNITWVKKVDFILSSHKKIQQTVNKTQGSVDSVAKYIIPVASGKGGVGKSTTALNIALAIKSLNKNVGILDADIYGPSLPKLTGINTKPKTFQKKIIPQDAFGLQSMSIGYLIPEDAATIWRGPMVMSAINQLLTDVLWKNLDYLIIDMPPGTGDAQLTLSQKTKLAGVIIISTPQDLSLIDARKGLNMFKKVNVPVIGMIENMSYFLCEKCNSKHYIFDNGGVKKEAKKLAIPFLGEIPININLRHYSDNGTPFFIEKPEDEISKTFLKISKKIIDQVENNTSTTPKIVIE